MELLFLPLSLHRLTRAAAWAALVLMHAGILLVVDFADLSIGMLMIHLFTSSPLTAPGYRFRGWTGCRQGRRA
ncbi:hypothetical protein [Roseimicrobium gellanilyticum]|uniref:hypothetical protein n=1 Tax=Roseimicrobium gellanilyticum TaxID=748857 RepID=UPI000DEBAE22|nr:hypothetical protein [Roseimicrobium gellanilyticum]